MKKSHNVVASLAGIALLIAVVAVMVASFRAFAQIEAAADARKHTSFVISHAYSLLSELRDAETGERGYALTGDETFLESYTAVNGNIKNHLDDLRQYTLLPAAREHLDAIDPLIDSVMLEMTRVIALRRSGNAAAAVAAITGRQGKRLMDAIRAQINGFIRIEEGVLAQNEQEFQANMRYLFIVIVTACLLTLLFALSFAYLLYRETRHRLSAATKISEDEGREYAESIINTVRESLIALDQDLRVVSVSRSFYEVFKVNPEETVGQLIYDLGNKQWDIPKLRELLEDILPQKAAFINYEVEHDFSTIGRRIMLLNARQIQRGSGKERIILLAIEDITERKEIEAGLEKTRKELEVIKISADESLEYAESIINTVREPLIALNQDLRVVTASRSFYEVFKVNHEETVGQLIYDLGNKQWDIPKLRELLEDILPQKAAFDNYEVEHDFSAIGKRIMLLNARQIQRGSGKERIILLAIEDITARKEIEAGLEKTRKELEVIKKSADESLEYAESIINTVREPLIALDQDLRVVTASRSFYEFFKVNPQETLRQLIYDLGNKQWDIPKLRELLETILPQKATFDNYEVEHDFSTIGRRTMLLNARQIQQGSGKERIILLAIEDITARKEIEAGLEKTHKELEAIKKSADESLEYAESIINTVREPLIALDQDLRVVTASRSFYEVFKVNPQETLTQLIYDLGNKQWDIPKLRELLETILPQKATFDNYEVEHDFSTIGRRIMLLNARQILRGSGKERIILLAIEDITERKQVENAMHTAKQAVEAASRAKSEFLANMSHELRTPLNSIIGFSEVLHDLTPGPLTPKQTKYVDNVLTAGQHLLSLINDILDISKVEAGKMTVEPRFILVRPLLENALILVKERALKGGLTISMDAPAGLAVSADELMLKQILFNLLSNAVKFTEPGGRITVTAKSAGDFLNVNVADNGIGIKASDQSRLFTEFEQLDSGYDRIHQGTGLGLALTRKFVELHGGRIWVESEGVGKGSNFCFTLPLEHAEGAMPIPMLAGAKP